MRSPRAAARRDVLKRVRDIKDKLATVTRWWDCTGMVYLPQDQRTDPSEYQRERQLEEYPEYQRRYWVGTIGEIDDMIAQLHQLRDHCVAEYHKTPKEG